MGMKPGGPPRPHTHTHTHSPGEPPERRARACRCKRVPAHARTRAPAPLRPPPPSPCADAGVRMTAHSRTRVCPTQLHTPPPRGQPTAQSPPAGVGRTLGRTSGRSIQLRPRDVGNRSGGPHPGRSGPRLRRGRGSVCLQRGYPRSLLLGGGWSGPWVPTSIGHPQGRGRRSPNTPGGSLPAAGIPPALPTCLLALRLLRRRKKIKRKTRGALDGSPGATHHGRSERRAPTARCRRNETRGACIICSNCNG